MENDNDDKILEQSAEMIQKKFGGMQVDRSRRDASDAGLQVRQIDDGEMDHSWKTKAPSGAGGLLDVEEAARGRQEVMQAKHSIEETGGLTMDDLIALGMADGGEVRENAQWLGRVAGHMVDRGTQQVVHSAYHDPNEASMLMEQEAYNPTPANDGWKVTKQAARLKSGKTIPVFVVEDSISGMTTGKRYRLYEVAEKVARVINATNNPDDGRVRMIDKAYDRHVELMRTIASTKKAIKEGRADKSKKSRLSVLEAELQEVNARLGLS